MAGQAVGGGMGLDERIDPVVIEAAFDVFATHPVPIGRGVARLARARHSPSVRIRVTVGAAAERQTSVASRLPRTRRRMTLIALNGAVSSGQGILGLVVIERLNCIGPVRLVMAVGAGGWLECSVVRIVAYMTATAAGVETQVGPLQSTISSLVNTDVPIPDHGGCVAVAALQVRVRLFELEADLSVVQLICIPIDHLVVATEVIQVARCARLVLTAAMQTRTLVDTPRQRLVAGQASLSGDTALSQLMAVSTVAKALQFGVRRGKFTGRYQLCVYVPGHQKRHT